MWEEYVTTPSPVKRNKAIIQYMENLLYYEVTTNSKTGHPFETSLFTGFTALGWCHPAIRRSG